MQQSAAAAAAQLPSSLVDDVRAKYLRYSSAANSSGDDSRALTFSGLKYLLASAPSLALSENRLEQLFLGVCGAGASRRSRCVDRRSASPTTPTSPARPRPPSRLSFEAFLVLLETLSSDVYSAGAPNPLLRLVLEHLVPHRLEEPWYRALLRGGAVSPQGAVERPASPAVAVLVGDRGVHVLAEDEQAEQRQREQRHQRAASPQPAAAPSSSLIRAIAVVPQVQEAEDASGQEHQSGAGAPAGGAAAVAAPPVQQSNSGGALPGASGVSLASFLGSLRLEAFEPALRALGVDQIHVRVTTRCALCEQPGAPPLTPRPPRRTCLTARAMTLRAWG